MPSSSPERKYALTKVKAGDYLLPSNDGKTIWRIALYTEGPSTGLDWPRDREVWGLWKWSRPIDVGSAVDTSTDAWHLWEFFEGPCFKRHEAIDAALKAGS